MNVEATMKKIALLAAALLVGPTLFTACGDDDGTIDAPYAYPVPDASPDADDAGLDGATDGG
jgi:hypothetical protein